MLLQAAAALGMLAWDIDSSYTLMWPPFVALGLGIGMVMAASSDAIVGNAPVRDGGVAGGLQATALQVGGALGTSVLMSVISTRAGSTMIDEFTSAGVPGPTADGLRAAEGAVAMGVAPVSPEMPAELRARIVEGSGQALMNGVHTAAIITVVVCLVSAALAAAGLGRRNPSRGPVGPAMH